MDVTEHPTGDGKAYLAVVSTPSAAGWWAGPSPITSAELVVDALQMALRRRQPIPAYHGAWPG